LRKIFIILTIFALNLEVGKCAQRGQVITPKSPVYSDPFLKGPIGSLSQGKKVILSDKTYGNGKSYMLVIGKNIAYIAAKDVVTETYVKDNDQKNLKINNNNFEHLVEKSIDSSTDDDFTKNNFLIFEGGFTNFIGGDWDKFNATFNGRNPPVANTYSIFIRHAPPQHYHSVSIGLGYLTQKDNIAEISGPFLIGELDFDFIENELFSLSIGLNAYITGELHLKIGLPKKRYTGTLMGSGPKLALNLFPRSKFGIEFLGKYQYYKAVNFDNLEVNGIDKKINLDEFSSFSFAIALKIQVM
tara:strand:+ start:373 stop:1272 length:900 start_codon:yes stop_codon:yes gene_type:complete